MQSADDIASSDGGMQSKALADFWLLSGLGSRGLIHHALMGHTVARAVLAGDEDLLIEHTRRKTVELRS